MIRATRRIVTAPSIRARIAVNTYDRGWRRGVDVATQQLVYTTGARQQLFGLHDDAASIFGMQFRRAHPFEQ